MNTPTHYHPESVTPLDVMYDWYDIPDFCVGNILKYICRAGKKGDAVADIEKALDYVRLTSKLGGSVARHSRPVRFDPKEVAHLWGLPLSLSLALQALESEQLDEVEGCLGVYLQQLQGTM